jgi:16S rRNA (uracil1498-N3)-methyltransferase
VPSLFDAGARAGAELELRAADYHHLIEVLRRTVGDPVLVLDGAGAGFHATLAGIDPAARRATVRLEHTAVSVPVPLPATLSLRVAVAVPRGGSALDLAVRLASELGLAELQPILSARTVARPAPGGTKVERWRRIALESARQCRRARALVVAEPVPWGEFVAAGPAAGGSWIALPGGPPPAAAGLLAALRAASPVTVAVGPEGGFTPPEVEQALAAGFALVGFPTPVLRVATAVVYLGALGGLVEPRAPAPRAAKER